MKRRVVIAWIIIEIFFTGIVFASTPFINTQHTSGGTPVWSYTIDNISAVAMSSNGAYLIVGCEDGYYYIFDEYGDLLLSDEKQEKISFVDIAPNSNFVVVTNKQCYFLTIEGTSYGSYPTRTPVLSIKMNENGGVVIIGTEDTIYIYDVFHGLKYEQHGNGHIKYTTISSLGNSCVAAEENIMHIFNFVNGRWISNPKQIEETINCMAISESGKYIVYGTKEGNVYCYDNFNNSPILEKGMENLIVDVEICEKKELISLGTENGDLFLFKFDGIDMWKRSLGTNLKISDISINENFIVAGTNLRSIHVLDFQGHTLWKYYLDSNVDSIFISKKGDFLSSVSKKSLYFFKLYEYSFYNTNIYPYNTKKCLKPGNLTELWSESYKKTVRVGDVNGDGKKEIITVQGADTEEKSLVVFDTEGKELWRRKFPCRTMFFNIGNLLDVTGDTILDIILSYYKDEKLFINFYHGSGLCFETSILDLTMFSGRITEYGESYGIGFHPFAAFDIDEDGKLEILSKIYAGYPLWPRGILCLEYESKEIEWFYPTAPDPIPQVLADIDNDGKEEILLGSNAPCNGVIGMNDTDDCHAYIFAINLRGEELWIKEIGEGFKRVRLGVADLENDGKKEIICTAYCAEDNWGQLFILDSRGDIIREETFDYSLGWGGIVDFDKNGTKEILVMIRSPEFSELRLYDAELNIILKYEYEGVITHKASVIINDLNGNGEEEIVLIPYDSEIIILDKNLEEIHRFSFPETEANAIIDNLSGCMNDLIIWTEDEKLYVYSYENEPEQSCVPWFIIKRNLLEEASKIMNEYSEEFQKQNFEEATNKLNNAKEVYRDAEEFEKIIEIEQEINIVREYQEAFSLFRKGTQHLESENGIGAKQYLEKSKIAFEFLHEQYNRLDENEILEEIDALIDRCDGFILAESYESKADKEFEIRSYKTVRKNFIDAKDTYEEYGFVESAERINQRIYQVETIIDRKEKFGNVSIFFLTITIITSIIAWLLKIRFNKIKTKKDLAIIGLILGIEISFLLGFLNAFYNELDSFSSAFLGLFIAGLGVTFGLFGLLAFIGYRIKRKERSKSKTSSQKKRSQKKSKNKPKNNNENQNTNI